MGYLLDLVRNQPSAASNLTEVATTTKEPTVSHRHWWIHFTNREPQEIIFSPAQAHSGVLALYPGAMIFLTVIACNLFGDALQQRFDRRAAV